MREMAYDDSRWVKRLSLMGCWDEAAARRAETSRSPSARDDLLFDASKRDPASEDGMTSLSLTVPDNVALSILDDVRSVRGQARHEYGKVFQVLMPFYRNWPSSSLSAPIERARLLGNLRRFSRSDLALGWRARRSRLEVVINAFQDNALKQFCQAVDKKDNSGSMREWAHVLEALGEGPAARQTFLDQSLLLKTSFGDPVYCLDGMGDFSYATCNDFFVRLAAAFNSQVEVVDQVFPPASNVVLFLMEQVRATVVGPFLDSLFAEALRTYSESYLKAVSGSCQMCLNWMQNVVLNTPAEHRPRDSTMVQAVFEPHAHSYFERELAWFKSKAEAEVGDWEVKLSEQDASMESMYMSSVNRQVDKRDFLTSFKKVVMMPVNALPSFASGSKPAAKALVNSQDPAPMTVDRPVTPVEVPTTELAAQAAIMASRLENIRSLFSIEVALNLVHSAKVSIERANTLAPLGGVFQQDASLHCELIFVALLQMLGERHIKAGFDQAIDRLSSYQPQQDATTPLVTFLELVHVGDLIQQMLEVFFEQELVAPQLTDRNDFMNVAVKEKKAFEQMLDARVATGLNKGIEVLMNEIEYICATTQKPEDFNPPATSTATTVADIADIAPSATAERVVEVISSHCKMLVGSTDKHMLDVFNQEVGMRLFTALCKHLKRQRISITGSLKLISDMNLYHAYIATLRNKDLLQFFVALRELSQIYLVGPSDAKALATIIADGQRFKGIFGAEEVYTFAARRADWYYVRGKVERAMYGVECVMM